MPDRPCILIPMPTSTDLEYNRQCWPQYAMAVKEAGGDAFMCDLAIREGEMRALARRCHGIVLPGSPADVSPERYGQQRDPACGAPDESRERCDWALLEHVFGTGTPLLAICYGMQSLNVFCGGTLLQDIEMISVRHTAGPSVGVAHEVVVAPDSCLAGVVDLSEAPKAEGGMPRFPINSSHHQAVAIPGDGLRVAARSTKDGVIEALELARDKTPFLLGVQWHPERTIGISASSRAIFQKFVEAAARFQQDLRAEVDAR